MKTILWTTVAALCLAVLTACGGGGGGDTPPLLEPSRPPISLTPVPDGRNAGYRAATSEPQRGSVHQSSKPGLTPTITILEWTANRVRFQVNDRVEVRNFDSDNDSDRFYWRGRWRYVDAPEGVGCSHDGARCVGSVEKDDYLLIVEKFWASKGERYDPENELVVGRYLDRNANEMGVFW